MPTRSARSFAPTIARWRHVFVAVAVLVVIAQLAIVWIAAKESAPQQFTPAKAGKGELKYIEGMPVLTLEGTPQEMGEQLGKLAGTETQALLAVPRKIVSSRAPEGFWRVVVVVARTLLSHAPERYRTEMNAAVKTANVDGGAIEVANALLELRRMGGCATLVVDGEHSATGKPLFGRNFDFPSFNLLDRYSLVTVYRPDGKHAFVSIGFPGLFGVVSGMNDAGLALATLDVYDSNDNSAMFDPAGAPLMFCYRQLLEECSTVAEAEKLLRTMKPTTWMNLTVCDSKESVVFELTPKNIIARRGSNGLLTCTNHFRSEELAKNTACRRYDSLSKPVGGKKLSVADVGGRLHAANQGELTIHSMVFEPGAGKLHLSIGAGPASARPLQEIDLNELLKAKP